MERSIVIVMIAMSAIFSQIAEKLNLGELFCLLTVKSTRQLNAALLEGTIVLQIHRCTYGASLQCSASGIKQRLSGIFCA